LIGVTAPAVTQLTDAGLALIYSSVGTHVDDGVSDLDKHVIYSLNSADVKSAN